MLAILASFAIAEAAWADHVLLVHGLGRSERSMRPMEQHLREAGYVVHNVGYPSRGKSPDELVAHLARAVEECRAESDGKIHFVAHSLGGILVRAYLSENRPEELGRVVQLAPPNHGSELVDYLGEYKEWLGPTGRELGTDDDSLPNRLGPPDYDLGVIAGRGSISLMSTMIPGPDDGRVSVESARLPGAKDFLLTDASHTFIMRRQDVAFQVDRFLQTGRFVREASSE